MSNKLIGVTSRIKNEKNGERSQFINERYLTPFIERGFNTIILSLDNPNIDVILALCDGFVIAGGIDINPSYYGQENKGESKGCDISIDELDKAVVEYAVKNKVPTLGICRGHQSINVFLGGTLVQDIGDSHQNSKHKVKAFKNRYLDLPEEFEVNSYHHQIVDRLADGLETIAVTVDNINEAFIHNTLPILAFQWHPEKDPDVDVNKYIFNKFKELILDKEKR